MSSKVTPLEYLPFDKFSLAEHEDLLGIVQLLSVS